MMKSLSRLSIYAFASVVLAGCGGSGAKQVSITTPVQLTVNWADRSRALSAPSSALSAKVTLSTALSTGQDLTYVANRNSESAAHAETYTTTDKSLVGAHTLTVKFYSQSGGTGDVVGTATANVTIDSTGGGIGTVTTVSAVTTVEVTADQVVQVPDTTQLTFTARNTQNEIVAVSPGSAFWSVDEGAENLSLTADGMATALLSGPVKVKASVDGVTSALTAVSVPAVPAFKNGGFESPALAANDWQQASATDWGGQNGRGIANGSGQWGSNGHSGAQYGYIQAHTLSPGQGSITQTVTGLVVGRKYKVTFWMKHRTGGDIVFAVDPNFGAPMRVFVDSTLILGPTEAPVADDWAQYTTDVFTASSTSAEFMFRPDLPVPSGNKTDLIDDIVLVPVAG